MGWGVSGATSRNEGGYRERKGKGGNVKGESGEVLAACIPVGSAGGGDEEFAVCLSWAISVDNGGEDSDSSGGPASPDSGKMLSGSECRRVSPTPEVAGGELGGMGAASSRPPGLTREISRGADAVGRSGVNIIPGDP